MCSLDFVSINYDKIVGFKIKMTERFGNTKPTDVFVIPAVVVGREESA